MTQYQQEIVRDHPLDVIHAGLNLHYIGQKFCLIVLTKIEGGAVRSPGAMMVVSENGQKYGYVSGGCIDEDIALRASKCIETGNPAKLRYGSNSPYMDIRLPCGGAIELLVLPAPPIELLRTVRDALESRKCVTLMADAQHLTVVPEDTTGSGVFCYQPKLSLRIAGRGKEPIALARLARTCGLNVELWSPDQHCLSDAKTLALNKTQVLKTPGELPSSNDDGQTAFVLMFHDHNWEIDLLLSALAGDAFYIGAVGSQVTHERRCRTLRARGVTEDNIARIHAPIGLIPSMRDASMLAVSALAEIVDAFHRSVLEQ